MNKPENPFQKSVLEMHPMNQVPYHVGHSMGLLNVNPQHDLYCSATQAVSYRMFHQGWSDGKLHAETAALKVTFLDKLLPQVASITEYLSTNRLGVWGGDSLPCALELIKKHVPLPGATIELPSQPVRKLADRLATAVCGDRQLEGFDVELLSQGHTGSRLSALIVEMAGYEAEAYALQDQVDEANSSVTALEQRVAELEGQLRGVLESGDWFRSALEFHNGDGFERQAGITAALAAK